jgi:hypothetical protein
MKKGSMLLQADKCKHQKYELVEIEGDIYWARCWYCFALFEFTKKEWEEGLEAMKNDNKERTRKN